MNPFDLNPFWKIKSKESFERLALDTFEFQYENNTVYRSYCDLINRSPSDMMHSENIPFLPVSFFKSMSVGDWIITMILTAIPFVGFILLCVWAFDSGTNLSKKNWAKAGLIIYVILFVLYILFFAALMGIIASSY